MKKTAVVFGGTGLVGSELIHELIKHSDYEKVIAVLRRPLDLTDTKLEQVICTDFARLTEFKEALGANDYFCCIGTTIKNAGSQKAFRQVDFSIPVHIAQLAEELSVTNLVVVSSMGANRKSSNFYLRTKGQMERTVHKTFTGNLKILRPSLLMGQRKEHRLAEKMSILFMDIFGPLFVGPLRKYRGNPVAVVVKAMIALTTIATEKVVYEADELQVVATT